MEQQKHEKMMEKAGDDELNPGRGPKEDQSPWLQDSSFSFGWPSCFLCHPVFFCLACGKTKMGPVASTDSKLMWFPLFRHLGQVKAKLNADREDIERREKAMNALEAEKLGPYGRMGITWYI